MLAALANISVANTESPADNAREPAESKALTVATWSPT
jgi:hypothetical protein